MTVSGQQGPLHAIDRVDQSYLTVCGDPVLAVGLDRARLKPRVLRAPTRGERCHQILLCDAAPSAPLLLGRPGETPGYVRQESRVAAADIEGIVVAAHVKLEPGL